MKRDIILLVCIIISLILFNTTMYGQSVRFRLTINKYTEKEDLNLKVKEEFGDEWRVADWQDLEKYINNIYAILYEARIRNYGNDAMVYYKGYHFADPTRHFTITRVNHEIPPEFLVHRQIENNLLLLGSWHDLKLHILCIHD